MHTYMNQNFIHSSMMVIKLFNKVVPKQPKAPPLPKHMPTTRLASSSSSSAPVPTSSSSAARPSSSVHQQDSSGDWSEEVKWEGNDVDDTRWRDDSYGYEGPETAGDAAGEGAWYGGYNDVEDDVDDDDEDVVPPGADVVPFEVVDELAPWAKGKGKGKDKGKGKVGEPSLGGRIQRTSDGGRIISFHDVQCMRFYTCSWCSCSA